MNWQAFLGRCRVYGLMTQFSGRYAYMSIKELKKKSVEVILANYRSPAKGLTFSSLVVVIPFKATKPSVSNFAQLWCQGSHSVDHFYQLSIGPPLGFKALFFLWPVGENPNFC